MKSQLNQKLKQWPGWALLLVVVVVVLAVGSTRGSGPQTQEDRIDSLSKRLACPNCSGESVFESRDNSSLQIRAQLTRFVRETQLTDGDIVGEIENAFGAEVLLVPRASGFDALIWVLPPMALVAGGAGLAVAFSRWKVQAAAATGATDADRALVEAAQQDDVDQ